MPEAVELVAVWFWCGFVAAGWAHADEGVRESVAIRRTFLAICLIVGPVSLASLLFAALADDYAAPELSRWYPFWFNCPVCKLPEAECRTLPEFVHSHWECCQGQQPDWHECARGAHY